MKRNPSTTPATTKATPPPSAVTLEAASLWQKREKSTTQPAPPQVWSRYIDSRLKQFTSR